MSQSTTVVAIPARLESKRLPRKLLADVGGPAWRHQQPAAVVLCTDSEELREQAIQWP